jgi:hypothetical protein
LYSVEIIKRESGPEVIVKMRVEVRVREQKLDLFRWLMRREQDNVIAPRVKGIIVEELAEDSCELELVGEMAADDDMTKARVESIRLFVGRAHGDKDSELIDLWGEDGDRDPDEQDDDSTRESESRGEVAIADTSKGRYDEIEAVQKSKRATDDPRGLISTIARIVHRLAIIIFTVTIRRGRLMLRTRGQVPRPLVDKLTAILHLLIVILN